MFQGTVAEQPGVTTIRWSDFMHLEPKQLECLQITKTHRFVLYGGSRGCMKSHLLRRWLVQVLIDYHMQGMDGVRVMLACESYPVLKDRQISKIDIEFPTWLGTMKETNTDGLGFYLNKDLGGGVICLRNLDDPNKYKGAEFAAIGIDQIEQITLDTFNIVRGSLRWVGEPRPRLLATGNPVGPGHAWNVAYWLEKRFPDEMQHLAEEFYFVRASPRDNPHLPQSYWDDLNTLPKHLRQAWVDGDYYVFVGQAFPEWRNETHIYEAGSIEIGANWAKWRAVDWGYAKPFCCLWFAKEPSTGRIYIYREVYAAGLTDRDQAKLILENTPKDENIAITYADPSMWIRKNLGGLVSCTADEYAHYGIPLTRGDNDRLSGKRKINRILGNLPDGKPGLMVSSECKNWLRTVPYLVYDETRMEDVDTDQDDHDYDTTRYGLSNTYAERTKRFHDPHPLSQFTDLL